MKKINRRDTSEILPGQYLLVDGVWGCIERVNRMQCAVRLTNGNVLAIKKRDIGDTFQRDLSNTQVGIHDEKICSSLSVDTLAADIKCKQHLTVYAHNSGRIRSSGEINLVGQRVVCASGPPLPSTSSSSSSSSSAGDQDSTRSSIEVHPQGVEISTDGYIRVDGLLSLNYDLFIPEGSYIYAKNGRKEVRSIRMNGETGITVSELHVSDLRRLREDTSSSIDASGVRTNEVYLRGLSMPLTAHLEHMQKTIESLQNRIDALERNMGGADSEKQVAVVDSEAAASAASVAAKAAIAASTFASCVVTKSAMDVAMVIALSMLTSSRTSLS